MSRKPQVFQKDELDGINDNTIIILSNFQKNGGQLINGDILFDNTNERESTTWMYYNNEFALINRTIHRRCSMVDYYYCCIPEHISESFTDIIDTFGDFSISLSPFVNFEMKLHKLDKTFIEFNKNFGKRIVREISLESKFIIIKLCTYFERIFIPVNTKDKIDFFKKSYALLSEPVISVVFCHNSKESDYNKNDNIRNEYRRFNHCELDYISYQEVNFMKNGFSIDDGEYFTTDPTIDVMRITGPKSFLEKKISVLFKDEFSNTAIVYKTEPEIIIESRITMENERLLLFKTLPLHKYKKNYKSEYRQESIKDICIAFAPFNLPPYVLLEIIDWLPNIIYERHLTKINLIVSLIKSIRKIKQK
jgi:hypothetical protein